MSYIRRTLIESTGQRLKTGNIIWHTVWEDDIANKGYVNFLLTLKGKQIYKIQSKTKKSATFLLHLLVAKTRHKIILVSKVSNCV